MQSSDFFASSRLCVFATEKPASYSVNETPSLPERSSLRGVVFVLGLAALFMTGCNCCQPPPQAIYNGETKSMVEVVADINANNSKVPTLWAHHYFSADIVDEKHQSHHVDGDGVLLFISPIYMRLKANSGLAGTVFELGSNLETFWLRLGPNAGDTMWWGNRADLTRMNSDNLGIPIRPDMILDVLGITTINPIFNDLPVPTMRFIASKEVPDGAYVFIWNAKLPDRWFAAREVWYDRVSKRPTLVLLYNSNGRVVMRAEFKPADYQQVALEGVPKAQWPYVPKNYHLFFPDSGSRMNFSLDETALRHKDDGIWLPDPRSFRMPDPNNVDTKNVIQVGKQAGG